MDVPPGHERVRRRDSVKDGHVRRLAHRVRVRRQLRALEQEGGDVGVAVSVGIIS